MIPTQTLTDFDEFANAGVKTSPIPAKYAEGYLAGETFPAVHANFLFNKASVAATEKKEGLESVEAEINSVLAGAGIEPDKEETTQLLEAIRYIRDVPIGVLSALITTEKATVVGAINEVKGNYNSLGSAAAKTSGSAAGNVPVVGTALGTTNNNIVVTDASGNLKPSNTVIGSAAGKTAGSAAGNVPLVGTALGTTNNNIVVTDANGKLKASGTTLGTAAGKTAGSAAGNVPVVGTALGTTNNNIVVTDTSGQLKPSGTAIGSAAGKTAGSAAGNVPLVGTALGTTNNNIVVTDTSGQLKPSETVIGSAAGKTAGSAVGNVPLVGTALGTTDGNLVATNTSGALKPVGKTAAQVAYWGNGGAVCSTAKATQAKAVTISGFALYTGVTVKVMFTLGNSAANPTLNVSSTGAKAIKVIKAGTTFVPANKTGYWRGATSTSSEMWQPYTTLELMYDGTDWVIIGNPVVEDYYSESLSYTVYANGLIEEQGITSTVSGTETVSLPITFSNANYNLQVEVAETNSSVSIAGGQFWQNNIYAVTVGSFKLNKLVHNNGSGNNNSTTARRWRAVGY